VLKDSKVHILGIAGTFMAGIATIARQLGYQVTGQDKKIYPPMSTLLAKLDIPVIEGYSSNAIHGIKPHNIIVGNALTRGMPVIEKMLRENYPLQSGADWLARNVLQGKHVLAVSGTHGKSTTSSMLAWILEYAGYEPGFLIGGALRNFSESARLGSGKYFVIEADEYDTAFFDKRSKFIHYRPNTLVVNNIEFDHADIFFSLADIKRQFNYLFKLIPDNGLIIHNSFCPNVTELMQNLSQAIPQQAFNSTTSWHLDSKGKLKLENQSLGELKLNILGKHNRSNALAAIAAANHVGVSTDISLQALAEFKGVERRFDIKPKIGGVTIIEDFAHHPTAISGAINTVKTEMPSKRLIAVLHIASNTMLEGSNNDALVNALVQANLVVIYYTKQIKWQPISLRETIPNLQVYTDIDAMANYLISILKNDDTVLVMSNGAINKLFSQLAAGIKDITQVSS